MTATEDLEAILNSEVKHDLAWWQQTALNLAGAYDDVRAEIEQIVEAARDVGGVVKKKNVNGEDVFYLDVQGAPHLPLETVRRFARLDRAITPRLAQMIERDVNRNELIER